MSAHWFSETYDTPLSFLEDTAFSDRADFAMGLWELPCVAAANCSWVAIPASTTIKCAALLRGNSANSLLTAASQLTPNRTRRTNPMRTPRIKTTLTAAAIILARTALLKHH